MIALLLLLLVAACLGVSAGLMYLLWNWIVWSALGGPQITYWQALGLMLLLGMIGRALRGKPLVSIKRR